MLPLLEQLAAKLHEDFVGMPSCGCVWFLMVIARVFPFDAGELCARIVWAFGILHHLPEAFETRVFLSMEDKRSPREIREQTQLVSLREDHFARAGLLRQDFPFGLFRIVYRRPPVRGITRVA